MMMRQRLVLCLSMLALLGAGSMLTGCNTTAGAGQDVSNAGHAVTRAADKLKP